MVVPSDEHAVEAAAHELRELLFVRGARRAHGGEDAAAGGGDLLVGAAGEALRELLLARARPGQVGVRVDEAGHQGAAAAVEPRDLGQLAEAAAALVGGADEGDAAVAAEHLGAGDALHFALRAAAPRSGAARRRQLAEVGDQQVAGADAHRRASCASAVAASPTWAAPSSRTLASSQPSTVSQASGSASGRHRLAFDLGEVGEPLERLQREVADVAELVGRGGEQVAERQLPAEQVEVDEVAPAAAADDGAELHQPEVEGGGDLDAVVLRGRRRERVRVVVEADRGSAAAVAVHSAQREEAVARRLHLHARRGGEQRLQQVAPLRRRQAVGHRHEVEVAHPPVPEVERQRRRAGEVELGLGERRAEAREERIAFWCERFTMGER